MARKINRLAALLKAETVYGTDSAPAAANMMKFTNVTFTPLEGVEVEKGFILPYLGHQGIDLAGMYATLEFDVHLSGSGAAGTPPKYGPALRASAYSETITADTDVIYTPNSEASDACSIYFNDDGVKHVLLGTKGNARIVFDSSKVPLLRFRMMGLLGAITDSALPTVDDTGWVDGLIAQKGVTTFSLHGYAAKLESLNIDSGNAVASRVLINDESIEVTDRKITGTAVIEAPLLATKNFFAIAKASTKGALAVQHGITAGNIVELAAAGVQVGKPTLGQTNNIRNMSLPLYVIPDAGDDELSIIVR